MGIFLRAGSLSLFFLLLSAQIASAEIRQWNFDNPEDYQFDHKKIELSNGTAKLVPSEPYRDAGQSFQKGQFNLNTTADRGTLELSLRGVQETSGPELPAPAGNREPGLAAIWHLDEPNGTNLLDAAGRTVAKASGAEVVSGQTGFGYARSFDGEKSFVFIPHYETLAMRGPFSVEAWVRPADSKSEKPRTIMSRWQTVGAQRGFALQLSTEGKLDFLVSPDGAVVTHQTGNTVLAAGVWHHVAAVYTGKDLRIYVDGVSDSAPLPFEGPVYFSAIPVYLGALVDNRVDQFFKGVIDEPAIYQRAMTETEALTHYGNLQGLMGLWHLNERSGVLTDASGYGQNGTAFGEVHYESEGRMGTALEFKGKGAYVQVPASSRLAPSNQMTLEAWVKPEQLPGLGQSATVLSLYEEAGPDSPVKGGGEFSLSLAGPDGRIAAYSSRLQPSEVRGRIALVPGVWQHIAVTWNDGEVRIYNNGVLDTVFSYTGSLDFSKMALRMGSDSKGLSTFSGAIDEVSVYRRPRTEQEIAKDAGLFASGGIYTSEIKDAGSASPWRSLNWKLPLAYGKENDGSETGLLHIYHLNDPEGATLTDSKGEIPGSPIGTYPVPGIFGAARWFAAKGYDKILSQKDFPSLSTFSIGLWFEFASGKQGLSDRLFSIGDGNPTVFRGADGHMHVQMQGAREIVGERLLGDSQWHHLVLTADGRSLFLYIDGLLDGNSPFMTASAASPLVLGNLKSTDTFQGAIDEFLFYNFPLDRDAVMNQFLRGRMDAKMLVRTSDDSNFSNSIWRGPQGARLAEDPGAYTAGLWHFEDLMPKGQPDEILDSGRFANHGTAFGKISRAPAAVIGSGVEFNGSTDFIRTADSDSLHLDKFTISAWIKPAGMAEGTMTLIDKQFKAGAPVFSSFALELTGGNRLALRIGRPGGYRQIESGRDGEVAAGRWNHVAAVYDRKEVRLYINGKLVKSADYNEAVPYDDGALYFGRYGSGGSRFFRGAMDEVHFQNAAASDQEIRGKYLQQDPDNVFRPFESTHPDVPPARYFQYQIALNTELPFASPAVSEVTLQGNSFPTVRPSISPKNGISYAEITHFADRAGKTNAGTITYQLSPDGANWYFHNGRHWVIAANAGESNTQAQIQPRIANFSKEAGIGSFYFRAFLNSPTGAEAAELDSVEVEYLPNKLTVIAPNGGEALLAGSEQVIRWNSAGDVKKVNIEYSKDNFKNDFHEIARGAENSGSFTWKVPDDLSTAVKVRVMDSLDPRIYDMSDISFRTTGKFELVSPNWNERWEAGSTQKIVWKTTGTVPNVKLEYSTDDFEKTVYPIVDSLKNEGEYQWKVPDHISQTVKVRVSDVRDPQVFDVSNDTFAITGSLKVLAPQPGARWLTGSFQEIRWQSTGTIPLVHLYYQTSKNEGDWTPIAENFQSSGSYMWQVPDDIDSQAKVRVMDAGDKKVAAESEPFSIIGGLRLLNPQGGEQWTAGTKRKIAWQTVGTIPAVDLEYKTTKDDKWQPIEKSYANTGSYVWEVPSNLAGALMVRVVDSRDPFVEAVHSSASNIIAGFSIKAPNGGEEWKMGTEQNIEWQTTGDAEKVRLEYSKDGFKKDIREIIAAASNLGSYTWKVPDDAALTAQVRVSDATNPAAHAISNQPFRIYGAFDIQIPKGGEKFEVGSMATLVWKTLGTIPSVKIEYSHDDFNKDARLIEGSAPNEGQYSWSVPDDIGNGYQIRISDVRDPKTEAYSKDHFSVVGNFHLLYPVGGEDLIAGTIARITWKGAGSVPVVRIDYSEDDFQKSFNTIADKAPNSGAYEWTVPNLIGRKFKLRIWDPSQPDSMDVMNQPARIVGGFKLNQPNGGEVLYVGDRTEIKWETAGTVPRVKLEFSADNFTKDVSVITDSYPNNGMYEWLVPNAPSGKYRVRISDPKDATAYDISNSDFIIRSRISLISPNGGEGWPVGEKREIRWQTSAAVADIRLEYTTDQFATTHVIEKSAPNTGVYEWTVPDDVTQSALLRVSDANDTEADDVSDAPFRIQGKLEITSPNGGETWKIGEQRAITWKTSGRIEGVRLDYSRDGFASEAKTIVESTPNTGHFNWTVPDDLSNQAKVRVMDLKDNEVQDMSDAPFEMAGAFVMLAPNGGESWHAGEKREITWMTAGTVKDISLDYSADDFKTASPIEHGLMNTGRYTWDVPDNLGEAYKVRICDAGNANACDFSDNTFAIRSPLEMTWPRGGEKWTVGSDQEIRWNSYGNVRRVAIYYSTKAGDWKKLIEELPNEQHFLFKVPDDISNNVFFKVADYDNEDLYTVSGGPVNIFGSFDLIRPDGGEKWPAGSVQKISWDTLGTVSNARLEYSVDEFKNDINLIEASVPNTGSYEWTLPARTGLTMKVRISDADHPEAFDVSKDVFKIMPGITVTSPNGGEKWTAGHKEKITWTTAGKSDWVKIEYSKRPAAGDGTVQPAPAVWTAVAEKVPNGGEYVWQLPQTNGTEFMVRVTDVLDPDASDISDGYFEIKPELILNRPAGGEALQVGSEAEILWDTIGTVKTVKIEYSSDSFSKDVRVIADKLENTGKFLWTVPDQINETSRIRISSVEDPSVHAISSEIFKILPPFEVLAPSALDKWTAGTEQEIRWNWKGTLDTVRLEYSLNDFAASNEIVAAAPNKGSYRWTVPDLAHSQVKIRVSDPVHPQAFAVSPAFAVIPGFKVTAPNGGEKLLAGERVNLEWQTAGTASKVKLEYGTMNQDVMVWKKIEDVVRNYGKYEWQVPEDLSSQVKIRVSDVLDSAASDESDAAFKILGVFQLLAPHADEILKIGSRAEIRWKTAGKVPSVKLEYSTDADHPAAFKPIEELWGNTGHYYWTVPDTASETVWVKISDAVEPDAFKVSEVPFKIRGTLAWDMPAEPGALNWPVGSVQTLKWNTTGTIPAVNIEYTTDQKTWKPVAMNLANSGNFGWTVPDDTAQNVKLRISDAALPVVSDTTERPAVISAQFKITTPKTGDVWAVAGTQKIQWQTVGRVQKVWLEFMTDGKKWQPLAGPMPDQGSYEWKVPDTIASDVKVRIFDGDDHAASADSGAFKISGVLEAVMPQGGEVWQAGDRKKIEWQTTGSIPKVRLEAFTDETSLVIADNAGNKGSFEWTVPDQISDKLKIRVSDVRDPSVNAVSANVFSIIARFKIKSPKETDVWTAGEGKEIVWDSQGTVPGVLLEYSRDDFYRDVNLISSGVPNTGAALWTVPDAIGNAVKVRISDARDMRTADISKPFKIRGALAFKNPEAGEVLKVGSARKIEWQTLGTIPAVRLEYSRDDFNRDIQVINNAGKNEGRFDWTVPDIISNTVKLRVSDERDASVFAVSNPFKVEGGLQIKSPAGGEKFQVLSTQTVSWAATGTIAKVRLEYSKDDFNKDVHVIASDLDNHGSFDWVVPDDVTDAMKVRVSDAQDFAVSSVSPGAFQVRGALLLTSAGGQRWAAGSKQEITWETIGSIPEVRLDYSKDDFQKDFHIMAESVPNRGKFIWTVPDDISNTVRVRVTDAAHGEILSVSADPLVITGKLAWAPIVPEMRVSETAKLAWTSSGTIPVVRLEYGDADEVRSSPDAWRLITGSLENTGTFEWVVPDFLSDKAVLRISDARDAATSAVSPVFSILGKLSVALPSGGERWIAGTTHEIVWNTAGSLAEVVLEYSTDGFKKDVRPAAPGALPNTGRFEWTVPDAISNQVQVRVRDAHRAGVETASNVFSIAGDLSLMRPAAGTVWQIGAPAEIEWQTLGTVPFVQLEYSSADGGAEQGAVIVSRLENKGRYEWDLPSDLPAKIKIRILNADDSAVSDETAEPVHVLGTLEFTAPAEAGQVWPVGSKQEIAWKTRGFVPNVKLEFSRDGFQKDIQTVQSLMPNTGSFTWDVPDAIAPEVRLRVTDADNPKVSAMTAVPVKIQGTIAFESPQGGEVRVGAKQEISWKTIGSVPAVNLEYSTDGFRASRALIAEKVRNTGRYFWEIPDAARQKVTVRVSDASNPDVYDRSKPLEVHGGLNLISPKGGEIWKAGDAAELRWNTLGSVASVDLSFSTDEFATSTPMAAHIANKGSFVWRIPAGIVNPVKIKIADSEDPAVFSVTPSPVKVQGVLTVLAPQGGEFWTVNGEEPVIWETRGTIPFVNVEYSTDNFNTAVPVQLGLANEGRINFKVPDLTAEALRFRISDARDLSVQALSNPVRVGGRLQLLSPQGGEIFRVGQQAEIKWNTTGSIPKVRIEFSADGFRKDVRTIAEAASSGSFTWQVPDAIGKDYQIRIYDAAHPDVYDVSRAPFKIAGTIEITAPRAGETWAVGSRKTIEWETKGSIPFVRVEYSKDHFLSSVPIHLELRNTGKIEWQVPDFSGQELQFRVSDASDPSVSASTDFSISVNGTLSLTSPAGEEVWQARSEHPITWTTTGTVPNVSIEYRSGVSDPPVKIAESIANTGSFVWQVPDRTLRAAKVRVYDSKNPSVYSESPVFEVRGSLELTSPQQGEIWFVDSQHPLTWNSTGGIEKVRLEYSADRFQTVLPVALDTLNTGKFIWHVPDSISRTVQVRLSDASDPSVVSESKPFEIRGAIMLINPSGGETWAVGSRHPISWETTGTIPQVRVEYSADDFLKDIQIIVPALPNKGLYDWEVPNLSAQQIKVRVRDTRNDDVFDVSRNPVRIAGSVKLLVPDNGEVYRVGEKIQLRWRTTPNIQNVKLEYSIDDFDSAVLISNYVPNTGVFDWNVPDRISENVRVRVSDAADHAVYSASQVPFRIEGALKFTSPDGDRNWTAGSRQRLTWQTLGSIPKVRLEYSFDDFKTSVPIATNLNNAGSFDWIVPEAIKPDLKVRISDDSAPSVQAVTPGTIHVSAGLEWVTPAGGERWVVGEERIVRWRTQGMMPKVMLEYSKDGFHKDVHLISQDAANLGSYAWKVPNDLSGNVRLRIKNPEDAKTFAVSEPFTIDLYKVTWTVRDTRTGEHLIGLTLTDTTGKAQKDLSSPLTLGYPYGIYTTIWSKPGYAEYRSTWLADKDLNFTVYMNPETKLLEGVRFDFHYDRDRDQMAITSWYEKDGRPMNAVIQSEVRVYKDKELIKTLIASAPDQDGIFHMVWDTYQTPGDERYTASAMITAASGKIFTSPVSFQLDIPVKERKEPVVRQDVSSIYLKPLAAPAASSAADSGMQLLAPPAGMQAPAESVPSQNRPAVSVSDIQLQVPSEAVLNETVSIQYSGPISSQPVLDLYDANRKLVLRAQPMQAQGAGKFTYLLPVRGNFYTAGKPVSVSVIDLATRQFKTASIMIKSPASALGLDRQAGAITAQELLLQLDEVLRSVQEFQKSRENWDKSLTAIEDRLGRLAGSLIQPELPPAVLQKLNDLGRALAQVLESKGYDARFLTSADLAEGASLSDVEGKMRQIRDAVQMLRRLYEYSVTR